MRPASIFSFLFFSIFIFAQEPGMKLDDFRKKFPGIVPSKTYYNESIARQEQMGGFNGTWYFSFLHDTLNNVFYSENLGGAPEQKYIAAFTGLKNFFIRTYGHPVSDITKDTLLNVDRERVSNKDTLMVVRWQMKQCEAELGLFYTGNRKTKQDVSEMVNQQNAIAPMNYYILTINCFGKADSNAKADWKFYPGMTPAQLMIAKPDLFPDGIGVSGQWNKKETLKGLKGEWTYDFKNNILDWASWNYYAPDVKKPTFLATVKATKSLVATYKNKYGNPSVEIERTTYKDVTKGEQYRDDIMLTEWNSGSFPIVIKQTVSQAKGNYLMSVKIEMKRK